jgi:hypothetical protein
LYCDCGHQQHALLFQHPVERQQWLQHHLTLVPPALDPLKMLLSLVLWLLLLLLDCLLCLLLLPAPVFAAAAVFLSPCPAVC